MGKETTTLGIIEQNKDTVFHINKLKTYSDKETFSHGLAEGFLTRAL